MKSPIVALLAFAVLACTPAERPAPPAAAATPRQLLYVFAGDTNHAGGTDFLAVIDADSASATYAQVLATTPIGAGGTMPHHTEMQMPAGGRPMFANAFMAGRTYLFDFADPLKPRIAGMLDSVPGFRMPHSYARLADGTVLATL